jgi:hypothetical protein
MRFSLGFLLLTLTGLSFAQDTNFPVGPQYLITTGSPMLMQSIATPTLTFSSAIPDAYMGPTELAPSLITTPVTGSAATDVYLGGVYWGEHKPEEIVARRLETPILTAEQTAAYTFATATYTLTPPPEPATVPVEMKPESSVIEITSAELPANLPASIFNPGVTAVSDPQSLRERGYGVSLGELAAHFKSHKRPGARVFTNEDLQQK